jgi:WS/DGAT/MGAT family acyltransferase
MERLTALDGFSLHAETDVMRTHAGGLLLIDPHTKSGELTADDLVALLAERTPGAPGFRKRLIAKPLGLGQPVWVDDPDFDVRQHLHRVTLAAPGTRSQLAAVVGDLHSRRQDRNRPLWDAWVIDGLDDGRIALLVQLSHAMTDGVGGVTAILPQLMTTDPDAEYPPLPKTSVPAPHSTIDLIGDMADELVVNTLSTVQVAVKSAPAVVEALAQAALQPIRKLLSGRVSRARISSGSSNRAEPSPRTALNRPITSRRSIAFATVAMADLKAIGTAHNVTINDIFLTAATASVRRWLEVNDTVPDVPLRTLMPINTRVGDDTSSNKWTLAMVKLPVQLADPLEQLRSIHAGTKRMKGERKAAPAVEVTDLLGIVPPVLIGGIANLYTGQKLSRFHAPLAHLATSNIPGPKEEIYCAGAHVVGMFPTPPLYEGANLNITAVSHGAVFDIAIIACPDNVKDVESVAQGIEDTVRGLVANTG